MDFICKLFDAAYSEQEKSHVHGLTLYLWHSFLYKWPCFWQWYTNLNICKKVNLEKQTSLLSVTVLLKSGKRNIHISSLTFWPTSDTSDIIPALRKTMLEYPITQNKRLWLHWTEPQLWEILAWVSQLLLLEERIR